MNTAAATAAVKSACESRFSRIAKCSDTSNPSPNSQRIGSSGGWRYSKGEGSGERKQKWKGGVARLCGLSGPVGILSSILSKCVHLVPFWNECLCVCRLRCVNALTQALHALLRGVVELFWQPLLRGFFQASDVPALVSHVAFVSNHMQSKKKTVVIPQLRAVEEIAETLGVGMEKALEVL